MAVSGSAASSSVLRGRSRTELLRFDATCLSHALISRSLSRAYLAVRSLPPWQCQSGGCMARELNRVRLTRPDLCGTYLRIVLPYNHNDSDANRRNRLAAGGSCDE